jgi:hypothetical protein
MLQDDRAREIQNLKKNCQGDDLCERGIGVHLLAVSLMLDDWDAVKTSLPLSPSSLQWLEQHRADIQGRLASDR